MINLKQANEAHQHQIAILKDDKVKEPGLILSPHQWQLQQQLPGSLQISEIGINRYDIKFFNY
jgi:hypothetical protein